MRAVVQRVSRARVAVHSAPYASIDHGLLIYLGVAVEDDEKDARYLADKISTLRVFPDDAGEMNCDVQQSGGAVLVVSAFTVQADARRGRRPSLSAAASPEPALLLYQVFCDRLAECGAQVARGAFGEDMAIDCVNDGPVCVLLDSRRAF